jgi:hypothetical protein
MAELAVTIDTSIRDAVTGLRDRGYSRADIGSRLGVTRQAAQQRWIYGGVPPHLGKIAVPVACPIRR